MSEGTYDRKSQSQNSMQSVSMDRPTIARWAFIIGLILAVIIALVAKIGDWANWLMILLALYAGWEFVAEDQELHFFLTAIALALFSQTLGDLPSIGKQLTTLLTSVSMFFGVIVIAMVVRKIVGWVTGNQLLR